MKRLKQNLIVFLLLLLIFLSTSLAIANEKVYVLSYSPDSIFHQLVRDRIKVVYERAGIQAKFIPLPHNRSLASANEGTVDGDVGRITSVEEKYPNLLKVNVKLMNVTGAVYTTNKDISLYHDYLLKEYRVGHVLGVSWTYNKMKGLKSTTAHDYKALFEMLIMDRVDIVLATGASADAVLNDLGEKASKVRKLQPFIFTSPIYHYVNKKNKVIIPRLEKALKELKEEGYWLNK